MDNRYNSHNRRKYNLKAHIVLVTKYRKHLLKDRQYEVTSADVRFVDLPVLCLLKKINNLRGLPHTSERSQ